MPSFSQSKCPATCLAVTPFQPPTQRIYLSQGHVTRKSLRLAECLLRETFHSPTYANPLPGPSYPSTSDAAQARSYSPYSNAPLRHLPTVTARIPCTPPRQARTLFESASIEHGFMKGWTRILTRILSPPLATSSPSRITRRFHTPMQTRLYFCRALYLCHACHTPRRHGHAYLQKGLDRFIRTGQSSPKPQRQPECASKVVRCGPRVDHDQMATLSRFRLECLY